METSQNEQNQQVAGFVAKTFEILNNQEFQKIIFWANNGAEFVIKDINKFQEIVLPKYFRHRNVNSFIRQLNMYGFHKARKQNTRSVFSHPYFMRNRQELLPLVKRKLKITDESNIDENAGLAYDVVPALESKTSIPAPKEITSSKVFDTPKTIESSTYLKQPSTKELIKTNLNMNMTMKRFSFGEIQPNLFVDDRDDCVSIQDQIEKTKTDFSRRLRGISLVNTSNFLQEVRGHY